jgi:hypothetical protein
VLSDLIAVTAEMGSLADELGRWIDKQQRGLPDQERRLHDRADDKRKKVGLALERLRDEYDRLLPSGKLIAELHQDIETSGQEMDGWLASGLGRRSRDAWLTSFREAEAVHGWGREAEERYNGAREQVVEVFEGIDASLGRAVQRLWAEVATALRTELTEAVVPAGTDSEAVLSAFKDLAEEAGATTVADATQRLLRLRMDYGSIFLRVGRPIIRQVEWDPSKPESQLSSTMAAAAGAAAGAAVTGAASPFVGQAVADAASHIIKGPLGDLAAELGERGHAAATQSTQSKKNWWHDPESQAGPSAAEGSGSAAPGVADGGSTASGSAPRGATQGSGEFARAEYWYSKLTGTVEQVVSQLKQELHDEAQRTQRVLAAATEIFKDTATSTPGIEFEYAKICHPYQRQIWPDDFAGSAATIAADLAELRQRAAQAFQAAAQVTSLAGAASHLQPAGSAR